MPSCHGCLMGGPGWLPLGREFHFADREGLGRGWFKGLGCVSIDYHLGRAGGRRQELAGIKVQSGSHCEPTDTCLAWLALAESISGRDGQEMGGWLRVDSEKGERVFSVKISVSP